MHGGNHATTTKNANMRTLTPSQIAARDARRDKFRKLCKQVADMSEEQRATLAASMPGIATCEGRVLSLHNVYLIALQCPGATIVGGFKQWQKVGRAVHKGEHGLMIWVPAGVRKGEPEQTAPAEGETESGDLRFIMATVFDVSQTHEIETGRFAVEMECVA